MKKRFVSVILLGTMLLSLTGCQSEWENQTEEQRTPQQTVQTEDSKLQKEYLKWPEAMDKTEGYTGNFTKSIDGRMELFLRDYETEKLFYYDLEDNNGWSRKELKNKNIHKILSTKPDARGSINDFKRIQDGSLYCIYETVERKEDKYAGIGGADTRVYLVCLGKDGTGFEQHLLNYCNSGGIYDIQYIPVTDYYILEDGIVLLQYADGHSELYSLEENSVLKEFSEKTSKYGLMCVGDDIWRVGEDWMTMEVIDRESEESVRKFAHSFKRLQRGWTTHMLDGCGDRMFLLDGHGICTADISTDKEFTALEVSGDEKKLGARDCTIYAFAVDDAGDLYVSYSVLPDGKEEFDATEEMKLVKYCVGK